MRTGIRDAIRKVLAESDKPMTSRQIADAINNPQFTGQLISVSINTMPEMVVVKYAHNANEYILDKQKVIESETVAQEVKEIVRAKRVLVPSREMPKFKPYVPPMLRPDIQRRMDEFRAIPSLYN